MLNTRDEQHTLSQPTRRRANTANGKEGLKHASTLRYIQNTGQGQRGGDMLRPRIKAMRAEMQQHTESAHKTCIPETTPRANAETHPTTQTLGGAVAVAPALASLAAGVVLAAVAAAAAAAAPLGVVEAMYAGQIVAAVAGL